MLSSVSWLKGWVSAELAQGVVPTHLNCSCMEDGGEWIWALPSPFCGLIGLGELGKNHPGYLLVSWAKEDCDTPQMAVQIHYQAPRIYSTVCIRHGIPSQPFPTKTWTKVTLDLDSTMVLRAKGHLSIFLPAPKCSSPGRFILVPRSCSGEEQKKRETTRLTTFPGPKRKLWHKK